MNVNQTKVGPFSDEVKKNSFDSFTSSIHRNLWKHGLNLQYTQQEEFFLIFCKLRTFFRSFGLRDIIYQANPQEHQHKKTQNI